MCPNSYLPKNKFTTLFCISCDVCLCVCLSHRMKSSILIRNKVWKKSKFKGRNNIFFRETEKIIEEKESTKDLGILMQNYAGFSQHIEKLCSKVKQKAGWIFKPFYFRRGWFLRHMWNSLFQCHIDYCIHLWALGDGAELQTLEKLLKDYLRKIPELKDFTYWEKLAKTKINQQQRILERYRTIYVWKTLEGNVTNSGITVSSMEDGRGGRK